MEFLFFIFPLLLIFGGHKAIVEPFLNGKLEIDPYTYPTLYRAQRILRARNTKAREKELTKIQSDLDYQTTSTMLAIEAKSKEDLQKARSKHHDEILDWGNQFEAITAAEDAARLAEENRLRAEANAARQRVLEENRQKEREAIRQAAWDKNREDEARYNAQAKTWANNPANSSYGTRYIDPNKTLNVREQPNTSSRLWGTLVPGLAVHLEGWIYGEALPYRETGGYNNIWFLLRETGSDKLYIWSGGLTNASTAGIKNLNPPENDYKTFLNATLITSKHINATTLTPRYELPAIGLSAIYQKLDRIGELSLGDLNKLLTEVKNEFTAIGNWSGNNPTLRDVETLNSLADAADAIRAEKKRRTLTNSVNTLKMSEGELDSYKQARRKYQQERTAKEVADLAKRIDVLPQKLNMPAKINNSGSNHKADSLFKETDPRLYLHPPEKFPY